MAKKLPIKLIIGFVKKLVRGAAKAIPAVNTTMELADNLKAKSPEEKEHSYLSILIQYTVIACIIYAFVTKAITVDDVIRYLGFTQ